MANIDVQIAELTEELAELKLKKDTCSSELVATRRDIRDKKRAIAAAKARKKRQGRSGYLLNFVPAPQLALAAAVAPPPVVPQGAGAPPAGAPPPVVPQGAGGPAAAAGGPPPAVGGNHGGGAAAGAAGGPALAVNGGNGGGARVQSNGVNGGNVVPEGAGVPAAAAGGPALAAVNGGYGGGAGVRKNGEKKGRGK